LPDFSALWGYFFSIARKKSPFDPLGRPPLRPPSGAEVNFLLAFVGRAATMNEKFTMGGARAPLDDGAVFPRKTPRGGSECASHR